MTIYIVTSGHYSDYAINAVFSTEEKAREFIGQGGSEYEIEPWELDELAGKQTRLVYAVTISLETGNLVYPIGRYTEIVEERWSRIDFHYVSGMVKAQATSQERATKLAGEARQAYLRELPSTQRDFEKLSKQLEEESCKSS